MCSTFMPPSATAPSLPTSGLDHVAFYVVYGGIISIGTLGNILVILFIICLPKLRITPNMFIVNMCFSDILLGCYGIVTLIDVVTPVWRLSEQACKMFAIWRLAPVVAVVFSMTTIAWNRHRVVTSSVIVTSSFYSGKKTVAILSLVWVIALLICTPFMFGWITLKTRLYCACCFYFMEYMAYGVTITILVFVVPNAVISYYYVRIWMHVRHSKRAVGNPNQTTLSSRRQRRDVRLAVQFILLILIFNVCYLPSLVVVWVEAERNRASDALNGVALVLFSLNLALNPLVYVLYNRTTRAEIFKAYVRLRKRLPCLQQTATTTSLPTTTCTNQPVLPSGVSDLFMTSLIQPGTPNIAQQGESGETIGQD